MPTTTCSGRKIAPARGRRTRIPLVEKVPGEVSLGVEYLVRLAPYNIARVRVEHLGRSRAFVHWVYVPPAFRGRGLGQLILGRVLADADRDGVSLHLIARSCGTLAQTPLEQWYAANGFVRRGRASDGTMPMTRRAASAVGKRHRVA